MEIFASQGAPPGGYQRNRWKNLPTVSTIPAVIFATGTAGVVDTGGKFVIGVNDTSSKFAGGKQWEQNKTSYTLK
jgi:hypothetical protein